MFAYLLTNTGFWATLASMVGAVLTDAGVGSLSGPTVAVINGVAGLVVAVFVALEGHKAATKTKTAAADPRPAPAVSAPDIPALAKAVVAELAKAASQGA